MRDLTLVIPTFNRSNFLARLIAYYRRELSGASVLVLDSSNKDECARNATVVEGAGPSFRHVVFPPTLQVGSKLAQGLSMVNTRYSALCADDDLLFVEGLTRALEFLRAREDYVCADGIYLNFFPDTTRVRLKVENASEGIAFTHPGARIFRLFQRYQSLFYGVFRTTDLLHILDGVSRLPSLHFQELFQACAALLIGKTHRLPLFYAGRQHCEAAEPTRERWQTYYWFAEDRNEFLEHYVGYREELWAFYEKYGEEPHLERQDFIKAMDLSHAVFFSTNCPPRYFYSVLQTLWPGDTYVEGDSEQDDVCNQLRGSTLRVWGSQFSKSVVRWLKFVSSYYGSSSVSSLNRVVQRECRTAWICDLVPELRWMAGDAEFRRAYIELCRYLDRGGRDAPCSGQVGECENPHSG